MHGPEEHRHVESLTRLAGEVAEKLGLELLTLKVSGGKGGRLLRLDIDRAGPVGINLEDCESMSASFGLALEEAALFDSPYTLEVSSPGVDRPIATEADARRNTGRRVVVETRLPCDGKKRFVGVLANVSGSHWIVRGDDGTEWAVPSETVIRACQDCKF